jgi:hypothetical protein
VEQRGPANCYPSQELVGGLRLLPTAGQVPAAADPLLAGEASTAPICEAGQTVAETAPVKRNGFIHLRSCRS